MKVETMIGQCVVIIVAGRRARLLIIAAWVVSAVFSTPMLVLYEEGLVQGQVQCWIDLPSAWQWQLYLTLVAVSLLVLPALLIFACYIVIVRTIWVQSAALMTATTAPPHHSRAHTGEWILTIFVLPFPLIRFVLLLLFPRQTFRERTKC